MVLRVEGSNTCTIGCLRERRSVSCSGGKSLQYRRPNHELAGITAFDPEACVADYQAQPNYLLSLLLQQSSPLRVPSLNDNPSSTLQNSGVSKSCSAIPDQNVRLIVGRGMG